ncbi:unnamed protein product [Microthlaspi erraticum]|uniref:RNase H type-1 domain-containing protein n=1 Tax=Microthlaspi erraticum TaxID=1685480 RepID=A0A6D2ICH7_9BRAS|nr:unnamed protein product [Microthlaspi erraticum]
MEETYTDKEEGRTWLEAFNDALVAKLSWRILSNPKCLLARVLKGKYFRQTTFLEARSRQSASHRWQGIVIGRNLLREQLGIAIRNGAATSLWNDPWISLDSPTKPMGPATEETTSWRVSQLIDPHTKTWDKEKIRSVLPGLEQQVLCIKPSLLGKEDKHIWLATESGDYTSKTGYHIAREAQEQANTTPVTDEGLINWNRDVWNAHTSQKLKVFLWKLSSGALALGDNLLSRGLEINAEEVPITNLSTNIEEESFTEVIQAARNWICLPPIGTTGGTLFPWICWFLWLTRNNHIFDEKGFTRDTISKAIAKAREWEIAQIAPPQKEKTGKARDAGPPNPQTIVCFVDAAWRPENQAAGYGWVFKSGKDEFLKEGCKAEAPVRSPLAAEALALREALLEARSRGWTDLCIKSDSQTLVRAIRSNDNVAEIYGVVQDIHLLATSFVKISVEFTPRSQSQQADSIAKLALSLFVPFTSFVSRNN